MKILSKQSVLHIHGGNSETCQSFLVGHNYIKPDGTIKFVANYIQNADGSCYGFGVLPEGYELVSKEIVIKSLCD